MFDGLLNKATASGSSPYIATQSEGEIRIFYRAKIGPTLIDTCFATPLDRYYFYVLENGIEYNEPFCFKLPFNYFPLVIPPNCFCRGEDNIKKIYFDGGKWDRTGICFLIGSYLGPGTMKTDSFQLVCCCTDCPSTVNNMVDCWWPQICGHRIRIQSYSSAYWILPVYS